MEKEKKWYILRWHDSARTEPSVWGLDLPDRTTLSLDVGDLAQGCFTAHWTSDSRSHEMNIGPEKSLEEAMNMAEDFVRDILNDTITKAHKTILFLNNRL